MRKLFLPMVLIILALSPLALAVQIRGDYLETRSADVYTGSCFANGEVNLVGNQAILAWHIESGTWNGVQLDGLTVAAAVRARATLGDPYANPYPAQAVLIVDDQANARQRAALTAFAQHMGGDCCATFNRWLQRPWNWPLITRGMARRCCAPAISLRCVPGHSTREIISAGTRSPSIHH